jgi:hypothetical protein
LMRMCWLSNISYISELRFSVQCHDFCVFSHLGTLGMS